jgi:NAD(P)-dependent dehydrogenase (short-subunit alcohol dehydrogenase family)
MDDKKKGLFLDKFRLPGKIALVTGGSRGIGRSIALGLAEAGSDIGLASRKLPDLEKVAQEITDMGRKAFPVLANVRHLPEIDNLVKKTMDEFGHIDILVNNAGTNPTFGSVLDVEEGIWDVTMGLNLKGCFFLSQAVGKIMRDKGGGSIINVASTAGITPDIGLGVYSISKAGVIMLTQVLAQEWGQYNIRVNAIAPGVVKTKLSNLLWSTPEIREKVEDSTALGRISDPEEMVGAVLFLASEASSYITGQTIVLDGYHSVYVRTFLSAFTPTR